MEHIINNCHRFFDAGELIRKHFDMDSQGVEWMTYQQIAEIIGVPITTGSMVQIGQFISKQGIKRRRTATSRMVLMPAQTVAKITSTH